MSASRLLAGLLTVLFVGDMRAAGPEPPVKLVVQITVDGLRPDMLHQISPRLGADGFRYLLDHGVEYQQAHYKHSATFTAGGHATLFTGTYAPYHGIVGNYWYDAESKKRIYCVADPRYPILAPPSGRGEGRSPAHLLCSTIGDELARASGKRSRTFSVSIKDRAAILPGGHLGQAYWYDAGSGRFVTSTYYRTEYPGWVSAWNDVAPADLYMDKSWTPLRPPASYRNADDDRPDEKGFEYLGKTFPHRLHHARLDVYHSALRYTPYADELLLSFVKELVTRERLGQQEQVDLLAVSFSATDYIQHAWGVNSLEAEDNLLRLDGTLADLFAFLDQQVGLDRTLIVLSADHGFDDIPEARQRLGLDAGRHDPARILARANDALRARYHTSRDIVSAFLAPSLYIDLDVVRDLGLDVAALERELAEAVRDQPGVAGAATRTDLMTGRVPDDPISRSLQWSFHPQRSGNVLVFQSENWYLYNDANSNAAMHGSPYRYDTHVPIFFAGPGIRYAVVSRPVGPEDVAPTIAAYLGINAPSSSVGVVLPEVVGE